MDALARDYPSLLADHEPPCLSLYQPTHRANPDRLQDPIRFRNLVKELEASLARQYPAKEIAPLLAPFHELAGNDDFWTHPLDGVAVFAAQGLFRAYRLQRPVREMAIVAESFHTKPLMRILQSADRYQVLGLNRQGMRLFEGSRYALDEVRPATGVPQAAVDVVGEKEGGPERKSRVYGGASAPGTATSHGTDLRRVEAERDTERFFRAVDEAVLENHSRPSGAPLLLAALPEHHNLFRSVSRNPFLLADAIDVDASALSTDALRERAWQIVLPHYLDRLNGLIERFGTACARQAGSDDLSDIARQAAAGRIDTLLIEADREVPGRFDKDSGAIEFAPLEDPGVDDLLDDLAEHALRNGGDMVIVPADLMPGKSGIAAIYRY